MGKWDQYAEPVKSASKPAGKWDQYAAQAEPAPKEEPGWFMPGSKSEAFTRGLSQGATLGFGDEIQAAIRRVAPEALGGAPAGQTYDQIRDAERNANAASAKENSGSYLAGNVLGSSASLIGAAPLTAVRGATTAARIANATGVGAGSGALTGLGTSTAEDLGGMATDTAIGAGVGAVGAAAPLAVAQGARKVLANVAGVGLKGAPTAASSKIAEDIALAEAKKRAAEAGVKTAADTGSRNATRQALESLRRANSDVSSVTPLTTKVLDQVKELPIIGGVAKIASTVSAPVATGALKVANKLGVARAQSNVQQVAQATTQALLGMSNQQTRTIKADGDAKIQQAVASGKPAYAATFTALQDPAYRTATMKTVEDEDDEE